jgi:hypothetical protein
MAYKRKRSYSAPRKYAAKKPIYKRRKFKRYARKAGSIAMRYGVPLAASLGAIGLTAAGMPYAGAALGASAGAVMDAYGHTHGEPGRRYEIDTGGYSHPGNIGNYPYPSYPQEPVANPYEGLLDEHFGKQARPVAVQKPKAANPRKPTGGFTTRQSIPRNAKFSLEPDAQILNFPTSNVGRGPIVTGPGDYRSVKSNIFLHGQTPKMMNSTRPGGGTVISFKEYLGDVISSPTPNTFDLNAYYINPTEARTFPWLSQLASNYQEWIPQGIIFHFKSMSGDALNSVNTSLGQVIMATNYDPLADDFQSKAEMENTEFAESVRPSSNCLHMIECARQSTVLSNLYTKSDEVGSRFANLAKFEIATNGCQGSSVNLGELWVTYQMELVKPKLFDALGEDVEVAWIKGRGVTNLLPLGLIFDLVASSTMVVREPSPSVGPGGSTLLNLPVNPQPKAYCVTITWIGASVTTVPPTIGYINCGPVSDMNIGFSGVPEDNWFRPQGVTATSLTLLTYVTVFPNTKTASLYFGIAGTLPSVAFTDIKIAEVPNSFVYTANTIPFQ